MLFHCSHSHTPETCPADDPQQLRDTFGKMIAPDAESGVSLIGGYLDAPAHRLFFVVETDSAEKVQRYLEPLLRIGYTEVRPVVDTRRVAERRSQQ
jgi:hypothetical protein